MGQKWLVVRGVHKGCRTVIESRSTWQFISLFHTLAMVSMHILAIVLSVFSVFDNPAVIYIAKVWRVRSTHLVARLLRLTAHMISTTAAFLLLVMTVSMVAMIIPNMSTISVVRPLHIHMMPLPLF